MPGIITLTKLGSSITLEIIYVPAYPNPTAKRPPILTIKFSNKFGYVGSYLSSRYAYYIAYLHIFFY